MSSISRTRYNAVDRSFCDAISHKLTTFSNPVVINPAGANTASRRNSPKDLRGFSATMLALVTSGLILLLVSTGHGDIYTYSGRMEAAFSVRDSLSITITEGVTKFIYNYPLPQRYAHKVSFQLPENIHYSFFVRPTIAEERIDGHGNRYLHLQWDRPSPGSITGTVSYTISNGADWDAFITMDAFPLAAGLIPDEVAPYLAPSEQAQAADASIKALAQTLTRASTRQYEAVTAVVGWVMDNISYVGNPLGIDALATYAEKKGVCSNYSHLALALLRAVGIPARYVTGYTLSKPYTIPPLPTINPPAGAHAWIEVYYPSLGWVPYDAQRDLHHVDTRRIHQGAGLDDDTRVAGSWEWYYDPRFPNMQHPTLTSSLDSGTSEAVTWLDDAILLSFVSSSPGIIKNTAIASRVIFNTRPVADAGEDLADVAGNFLFLSGTVVDPDPGDSWTYLWTAVHKPDGAILAIMPHDSRAPVFTADRAGTYVIGLVVTDSRGGVSDVDTVVVTLAEPVPRHVLSGSLKSETGLPAGGVTVLVHEDGGNGLWQAIASDAGLFELSLPAGGRYWVEIRDQSGAYLGGSWHASNSAGRGGVPGSVEPGAGAGSFIDLTGNVALELSLREGRTIAGRVVDNQGAPLRGVSIKALSPSGSFLALTDSLGFYRLTVAPASDYRVHALGGGGLLPTFHASAASWEEATLVDVRLHSARDIDFTLVAGRTISGVVHGLPPGKMLFIEAWSPSARAWNGRAVTGAGGAVSYAVSGLADGEDYRIGWHGDGFQAGYLQPDGGAGPWEGAALFSAGDENADIFLHAGHSISGEIGGLKVGVAAELLAESESTGSWGSTRVLADSTGNNSFSIPDLKPAADYTVFIRAEGFLSGFWSGTPGEAAPPVPRHSATFVPITNDSASGVHFAMTAGYSASGTISGLMAGDRAVIEALSPAAVPSGSVSVAGTNGGGVPYTLTGLVPSAAYRFRIQADGYPGGFYGAGEGATFETADLVTMTSDKTGIDFALQPGRAISGLITGLGRGEKAHVSAWSTSLGSWGGTTVLGTGAETTPYTISGLARADDFLVRCEPENHAAQERRDISSAANPTHIHFAPRQGASISGTARTAEAGKTIRVSAASPSSGDIRATVFRSAGAGLASSFTLRGLADARDYIVSADAGGIILYHPQTPIPGNAAQVNPYAAETIAFNFADLSYHTISGFIAGINRDAPVTIHAWDEATAAWVSAARIGNGPFTLKVHPGTYKIGVFSPGYRDAYYSRSSTTPNPREAEGVDLNTGGVSLGEITPQRGHALSGVVYDDKNGNGMGEQGEELAGAMVEFTGTTSGIQRAAAADAMGRYVLRGLPDDAYAARGFTEGTHRRGGTASINGSDRTFDIILAPAD